MADSELEILFEYQGSRKPLCRLKREHVIEVLKEELARFGDAAAVVQLSGEADCKSANTGNSYLLQKLSTTWGTYIDVEEIDELEDRDKVTVVPMPISVDRRPSSKELYGGYNFHCLNVRHCAYLSNCMGMHFHLAGSC